MDINKKRVLLCRVTVYVGSQFERCSLSQRRHGGLSITLLPQTQSKREMNAGARLTLSVSSILSRAIANRVIPFTFRMNPHPQLHISGNNLN